MRLRVAWLGLIKACGGGGLFDLLSTKKVLSWLSMLPLGHARTREDNELSTVNSTVQPSSAHTQGPLLRHSPIDCETDQSTRHATGQETRPRLARILDHSPQDAEEDGSITSDTSHTGSASGEATTLVHKVSSTDSLPSVALRYGVSVAALRRANKLWPSDPIYLRTELKVPRADPTPVRCNPMTVQGVNLPAPELPPRASSDSYASTVAAVGDAIISLFPGRTSRDSLLSSRTSSSEVLELDDLVALRASRAVPSTRHVPSVTRDGYELSTLGAQPGRAPATTTLPPLPCVGTPSAISASEDAPLRHRVARRIDPSIFIPVRISQLEPEPAMELPTRRCG